MWFWRPSLVLFHLLTVVCVCVCVYVCVCERERESHIEDIFVCIFAPIPVYLLIYWRPSGGGKSFRGTVLVDNCPWVSHAHLKMDILTVLSSWLFSEDVYQWTALGNSISLLPARHKRFRFPKLGAPLLGCNYFLHGFSMVFLPVPQGSVTSIEVLLLLLCITNCSVSLIQGSSMKLGFSSTADG